MSTMEETLREAPQDDLWREELTRSLDEHRQRANQLLTQQRERFTQLHTHLSLKMAELAEELARQETQCESRTSAVESREAALKEQAGQLAAQQAELARQRDEWDHFRRQSQEKHQHLLDELQKRLTQFDARRSELEAREKTLAEQQEDWRKRQSETERGQANLGERQQHLDRREEELSQQRARLEETQRAHKSETEQLTRNMAELNQIQVHFDQQRQALAEREREIARQRRNIARQLRSRKKEVDSERELLRAEVRSSSAASEVQLQQRLAEIQGKYERLGEELSNREQQRDELTQRVASLQTRLEQREAEAARLAAVETQLRETEKQRDELARNQDQAAATYASRDEEIDKLNEKIRSLNDQCSQLKEQLAQAQAAHDKQRQKWEHDLAAAAGDASPEAAAELTQLREANRQLEAWVREAEKKGSGFDPAVAQELSDVKRKLDMAVQDCRDLKARNGELMQQLESAKANPGRSSVTDTGAMDWESQKRRMLAQLEADFDENNEEQKAAKLSIEEAIHKSEKALAGKDQQLAARDQEIAELKRCLENQASSIGDVAVGASAIAGVLDNDELIRQERENLQKLQDSLREQLRKAEIELSMERAKVARERAEMEEKLHAFESEQAKNPVAADAKSAESGKKSSRGRWLQRLGLRDGDGK